jgi:peroxiredoxin family protein
MANTTPKAVRGRARSRAAPRRERTERAFASPPQADIASRRRNSGISLVTSENRKSLSIIVSKGTLDWAYPPFILATTAAAMDMDATLFFTFYGLGLLKKKLDLEVSPLGNPAMKMPMAGLHLGMPNLVAALPGVTAGATAMMKNMIEKKGVAKIEELRDIALESGVKLVACQMTMDLFEFKKEDMIDGISLGGAATYLEDAVKSDVNLFI